MPTYDKSVPVDACLRKSIGGGWLETEVCTRAASLLTEPETVLGELERRRRTQQETEENVSAALVGIESRLRRADEEEMKLTTNWLRLGISESIYDRQMALIKAGRKWCDEERDRLTRQLEQVRHRFATIAQVNDLRRRIGHRLANATFEDRRFVLEALETRISVSADDGTLTLAFQLPMPKPSPLLGNPSSRWLRTEASRTVTTPSGPRTSEVTSSLESEKSPSSFQSTHTSHLACAIVHPMSRESLSGSANTQHPKPRPQFLSSRPPLSAS